MRYKFYREHKYVSAALNDLERLIAKTDFRHHTEVENVEKEFNLLIGMLKGHAEYEDKTFHKLLYDKGSSVYKDIEKEHEHMDESIAHLQTMLKTIRAATQEEELIELGYQFYLWYRKFVGDNLLHLHEEETIILLELQRLYDDETLRRVEFPTYQSMSVDELTDMLQVLLPHMNPSDRLVFLTDIKDAVPDKFILIWESIQLILAPYERIQLMKQLPIK